MWRRPAPDHDLAATPSMGMLSLDDLKELGFSVPRADLPEEVPDAAGGELELPRLERMSGPAKALYATWAGQRVVCLQAPPGSGKSTSVVDLLTHLVTRLGLNVVVGCPTRAQAVSLGVRLYPKLPGSMFLLAVSGDSPEMESVPQSIRHAHREQGEPGVTVMTLAAAGLKTPQVDLMVVDEAYQASFADVAAAAARADQLLLVGDPGQIGPVVTVDTGVWDGLRMAPHLRAMQVFSARKDAVTFSIDRTYRLGPVTTSIIAPLYGFKFESRRPDRHLTLPDGRPLPEVGTMPLGVVTNPDDPDMLLSIADWVQTLTGAVLHEAGQESRPLTAADVAVVVARNSQSGLLTGRLAQLGLDEVTVGTADKLQGGEWSAVVALDACAGNDEPNDYLTSLGRLCVMASRHRTHLTWCWADGWRPLLDRADMPPRERQVAVRVREGLAAQPRVTRQVAA